MGRTERNSFGTYGVVFTPDFFACDLDRKLKCGSPLDEGRTNSAPFHARIVAPQAKRAAQKENKKQAISFGLGMK